MGPSSELDKMGYFGLFWKNHILVSHLKHCQLLVESVSLFNVFYFLRVPFNSFSFLALFSFFISFAFLWFWFSLFAFYVLMILSLSLIFHFFASLCFLGLLPMWSFKQGDWESYFFLGWLIARFKKRLIYFWLEWAYLKVYSTGPAF